MDLNIKYERFCVISDIHLGSPLFNDADKLQAFISYAREQKMNLCINGDGLDISQSTISRMAQEIPIIFNELVGMRDDGLDIYYVVGNHDIIFEYFLRDWGVFKVVPFLNLTSGDKLIRIEHSHIYDKLYMKSPSAYKVIEIIGGFFLKRFPLIYKLLIRIGQLYGENTAGTSDVTNTNSSFRMAADNLMERGFDAVIFGHTHRPGVVEFPDDKIYMNLGTWTMKPFFASIINGDLKLNKF